MNDTESVMAQEIARVAIAYQTERTGHAPASVTVVLSDETLVITLHDALTPAEKASALSPVGASQVQEFHRQLFLSSTDRLRKEIKRITGREVRESAAEIEPATGSVVHAFTTGNVVQVYRLEGQAPVGAVAGNGAQHGTTLEVLNEFLGNEGTSGLSEQVGEAHKRFLAAIESVAEGKPIVTPPVDDTDDQLLRVLIVDDHRATADTLSALVRIWGHEVRRAYDAATGLVLAAAFRPDVLLLDMLMPNLNGFEMAVQVRRQIRLESCFIVAVTGRTDAKHRSQCYEAGVDLFLIKPVAPPDMQTLLTLELKRKRQLTRMTTGIPRGEFAATC